jgi:phosphoglycolate phosphatase
MARHIIWDWNGTLLDDTWLGEDPRDCLLIGDTIHDFEVAREIGVACRLIAAGYHPRRKLEACGVPVYGSLEELVAAAGLASPSQS